VDDTPYGGGSGMVMTCEPIFSAYSHAQSICSPNTRVVFMTPHGQPFNQKKAIELSKEKDLIILCGHYEGIDQRIIDEIVTDEISLGDYILTGGEVATIVIIDSISRLISGVLSKESSHIEESFSDGLLEYPHYTRPFTFMDKDVPPILLSGHHKNIELWRRQQSILTTLEKRPDLISDAYLTKEELKYISQFKKNKT
jgi:tRNA (guanine37-N1)-methyltransferase